MVRNMKTRVAVLFGGKSVEHEVSVISAIQAIMSMDTEKYDIIPVYMTKANDMYVGEGIGDIKRYKDIPGLLASSELVNMIREDGRFYLASMKKKAFKKETKIEFDIVFPIVHGTNVEDGTLQGFIKTIGAPFVGCDVTASAIGMDKYVQKLVLKENEVPVLDSLIFTLKDYEDINAIIERSEQRMGYPVIVKPVNLGSSVGIGVAKSREELIKKIDDAFSYSRRIIIEHAITYLREINCSVLGDENEAEASECEEPMHSEDILSYEDKYVSNAKGGKSSGMASVARKVPAEIPSELREQIRSLAVKSFKTLGCNGVARIDFMLDEDNGHIYFNEINTIPGSLAFYLWEPVGVPYKELLNRMIELGLKRAREESNITYAFDTNILNMDVLGGSKSSKLG